MPGSLDARHPDVLVDLQLSQAELSVEDRDAPLYTDAEQQH
jgi:hypothetical protein